VVVDVPWPKLSSSGVLQLRHHSLQQLAHARPPAAALVTSSCRSGVLRTPAAELATSDRPRTLRPAWRAAMTSWTVDMPPDPRPGCAASALQQGLVGRSAHARVHAFTQGLATERLRHLRRRTRRAGVYVSVMSRSEAQTLVIGAGQRDKPVRFRWSRMHTISPRPVPARCTATLVTTTVPTPELRPPHAKPISAAHILVGVHATTQHQRSCPHLAKEESAGWPHRGLRKAGKLA